MNGVLEMRLVVTAPDYEEALTFYRDVLGMPQKGVFSSPGGHVTILDAGRATLELGDPGHVAYVDEVEVGRRVAGHIRVAFRVRDANARTDRAVAAGAELIAPATETPWRSLNSRLEGPAGLQLTLFEELDPPSHHMTTSSRGVALRCCASLDVTEAARPKAENGRFQSVQVLM